MRLMRSLSLALSLLALACASGGGDGAAPPLAGTSWTVTAVAGDPLLAGTSATMVFGDDGKVSGAAGCNSYFASFEQDGAKLTIGLIGATKMYCAEPEGLMAQESRLLAALGAAATARLEHGRLDILSAAGASLLTLVAG